MKREERGAKVRNLSDLNPRQRDAVLHGEGPLLILAGAGTGKTRTIAWRIAHLVEQGVPPEEILAVAFTNKSADELRERVQRLLRRKKAPSISTFHSFCVRILRQEIEKVGYKRNFTIYDTSDQLSVIREVAREVNAGGRDLDAKRLLWLISRAKNEGAGPDPGDGTDEYSLLAAQLYSRYGAALRSYNALDFDDLLLLVLRLFREKKEVLARWKKKIRHVLVDEFQDTNAVQYELVTFLAAPEGNLTVVGDDDQSIYGWRGAAPGNIHEFAGDWPGTTVITLEQNYRSTEGILEAAHSVIEKNPVRRPKKLWSGLGPGSPVTVVSCRTGEDEAEAVVGRIATLVGTRRCQPGDCAVMYRTNAQSRLFEDVLRREGVRYVVVGGMRFYDRKEVRDLLAYLSFVFNRRDEVSLLRILNYPARGIGRETVLKLQDESLKSGRSLVDVMEGGGALQGLGGRQSSVIAAFLELVREMRGWFRPGNLASPARRLIDAVGLEEAVLKSEKIPERGWRKAENLRGVIEALASFEARESGAGLGDYLAGVNLAGREEESALSNEAVTLLTIHAAKGLEFPHVFLAGLEEGVLPHERSLTAAGGLEEERRLAYVGMTRAQKGLTLFSAAARTRWSRETICAPSRFLDELPEDDVLREEFGAPPVEPDPAEEEKIAEKYLAEIRRRL